MYPFGAIVLARFPFTDLTGDKRRPALVVSAAPNAGDVILCFITSVRRTGPAIAPILPDKGNGLRAASAVRFDKIVTLNTAVIAGQLGSASQTWL